ncbi:MAG: CrcB family protein [Candidatus Caenarcaniphilales bacterium]|nr:CrcB family protein [Candidatus Caenarcaniphilales bacterium]
MPTLLGEILYVSIGAILGASLRYLVFSFLPIPILLVNIIGSTLAGFSYARFSGSLAPNLLLLINIGFLGSLTTFSTFSLNTMNSLVSGDFLKASVYVLISVFACLLCCYIGYKIGISL